MSSHSYSLAILAFWFLRQLCHLGFIHLNLIELTYTVSGGYLERV